MSGICSASLAAASDVLSNVPDTVSTDSRKCSSYSLRQACTSRRSSGSAHRAWTSASRSLGGHSSASASTPFACRQASASIIAVLALTRPPKGGRYGLEGRRYGLEPAHLPPEPHLRGGP